MARASRPTGRKREAYLAVSTDLHLTAGAILSYYALSIPPAQWGLIGA